MGYKEVKDMLSEKIITFLQPIQAKYQTLTDDDIRAILQR
jgi:tryptophanyl-tRNA synthetase